jgi:regulator of replication initiation timing
VLAKIKIYFTVSALEFDWQLFGRAKHVDALKTENARLLEQLAQLHQENEALKQTLEKQEEAMSGHLNGM